MRPIVLITRPPPGGERFAAALRARLGARLGAAVEMVLSPILRIEPCGALPDLGDVACLLFTSQHGVARYAALGGRRDLPGYAVGEATATAAEEAGLSLVACEGDAASMLARIAADGATGPFLHLRGEHAAADLAADLQRRGHEARQTVLYRQVAEPLSDAARSVLDGTVPVLLPLFSPRSAALLFAACRPTAPLRIVAMSQAVADQVPACHAAQVHVARRPDAGAMLETMTQVLRVEGAKPCK